jgi:hypothetical protein
MRVYAAALALVLLAVMLPAVVAAGAPSDAAQIGRPPAEGVQGETPTRPYPWNKRVGAASRFARRRAARVSWAVVSPDGRVRGSHMHRQHSSASVVKAMLMVAYLRRIPGRALTRRDRALLRPMITSSNNGAATRVNGIVGNGLPRLARRARMRDFAYSGGSWGGTQVSPYDQARFFWRIERFVPSRHRAYARSLLAGVVGPQRWGVAPATPRGWRIFFKGGWVPPRRVNQVALLQRGRTRAAIAVFNQGTPSFRYGQETIEGVARRLLLRINAFRP